MALKMVVFIELVHLILLVSFFWAAAVNAQMTCKKINSCSCAYDDEHIIDLSPLLGKPKWSDQPDPQGVNRYSYNPCDPFDEGTCQGVALCQNTGLHYYALGTQTSAEFMTHPQTGALSIQYASNDSLGVTRTSQVVTQCVEKGEEVEEGQPDVFTALGETSPGSGLYLFTLSSKYCCPVSKSSGSSSFLDQLSIGSKITLGLVGAVVIYLCVGSLIQKYGRHQTGGNILPNHSLWSALHSLVQEGFLFTFTCGKHKSTKDYENI